MKITRDIAYRKHLLDSQRSRMGVGERREGIHVSDLVMCVRKSWAERIAKHIPTISDETILTWLRGLSHEALLTDGIDQVRSGYCFACQHNWPWTPEIADSGAICPTCGETLLTGTIDWVFLEETEKTDEGDEFVIDDYVPVEMKSTLKSSRKSFEDGDMLWFVDQIKSYMFMHNKESGRVAVLHVMGDYSRQDMNLRSEGPKADLRVYRVEWESEREKENWGTELQISKAVVEDPTDMPSLNLRSPRHNMICEYCVIGEKLPNGQPCELFPWTPEGTRRGSALAKKYTMDEIESELGAFGVESESTSE